jgi:hypothetical protein
MDSSIERTTEQNMKTRQFYLTEYTKTSNIFTLKAITDNMRQYAERQCARCIAAANIAEVNPDKAWKIYIGVEV